MEESMKIEIW